MDNDRAQPSQGIVMADFGRGSRNHIGRRIPRISRLDRNAYAVITDCAMLLALAAALRFAWLGHASLWIDELFSVHWAQLDLAFLLGEGARTETNPPTYYVLLQGWMKLAGMTEGAIRALSVLVSMATVLVVYALGRVMWDRATAVLAGVLLAVNPVSVMFAQEARAHALSALLNGLALLLFVISSHHSSTTRAPSWKWLPAFIVAVMATVLVHYASLLFVAACFAAAGLRLVGTRPFPIREMAVWSLAGIITFLGLWQVLILVAGLAGSNNLVWIEPLSAKGVAAFFLDLTVPLSRTPPLLAVAWGSLAALLLIVVLGLP
ncbi:MAG: glycosyltransferase family 39 protein, partial [Gammaproteobacteria bacterium]